MTQAPPQLPALATQPRGPAFPAWDTLRRNRHVTVPMAVPPAFLAAGAALATSPQAGIPTAVGAGVLAGSVWWAAPHKWDRRPEQWYARASALAGGAWMSATALLGLGVPELIAAGVLGTAWGIPWFLHKRTRKHEAGMVARWNFWWLHYAAAWDLAGSHILDVTTSGVIDTLHVQLRAGHQHLADVKAILPKLESALQGHVKARMTRCEVHPGNPSQVLVHLKRENPHKIEYGWDGSKCPTSITGTMPLGKDEHGAWVMVPCLAPNWFLIGALGGGKSNELSVMLASITGCEDALTWGIDLKGGKSLRPWIGALDWVATTVDEARLMLRALLAEVRARARDGYDGNEELVPTPDVPAIFLFLDEAHNIVSDMSGDPECQRLLAAVASECRSSAIRVVVATQYGALYESVGSEQIRGNLMNRICFKVADAAHGQFALDDWSSLDASRLDTAGEFYYRLQGAAGSSPCRGPHLRHADVREIAARNAAIQRPPLRLYAAEHQATYDARHDRQPAAFRRAGHPLLEAPMTPAPPPTASSGWIAEALERIEDTVAAIPDSPAPPTVDPALLEDEMTRKKRLWALLLQQAQPPGIRPRDLNTGSGMSSSWTHQQLSALIENGVVTKPADGRYLVVPGQDAWDGLQRIKASHDRTADLAGV